MEPKKGHWWLVGQCAALCMWAAEAQGNASTGLVNSGFIPGPGVGVNAYATVGWEFVPVCDVRVTGLGFFDLDLDGLNTSHEVGIWDENGQLLVSGIVPGGTAGDLMGEYRYVSVTPTLLQEGEAFIVGATVPICLCVPSWPDDLYPDSSLEIDPDALLLSPSIDLVHTDRFAEYDSEAPIELTFPDQHKPSSPIYDLDTWEQIGTVDYYFVAPNFQFTVIPEPASGVLLAIGAFGALCCWRRS